MSPGKILVIRGGAIGDFILTLPVFAALRRQFTQARIEVLGYPHIASLAAAGGLADAVRSIESKALAGYFAEQGDLDPDLAKYLATFAAIISFLYDPDGVFQRNVARVSRAQFIVGTHRPDESGTTHTTEVFLCALQRLAIFESDPVPRLTVNDVPPSPDPTLALHPGSGSERKNWPEAHWAELLRTLGASTPRKLLLVGGEAEGDRLSRLARTLPATRVEQAQNLPLPELARRLSACVGFVGHDSGITHLAAAIGLPGVVLWGETHERVWRPRSERMTLVRSPHGLAQLSVSEVWQRVKDL